MRSVLRVLRVLERLAKPSLFFSEIGNLPSVFRPNNLSIYRFSSFDLIFEAKTELSYGQNDNVFETAISTVVLRIWANDRPNLIIAKLGFGGRSSHPGERPPQLALGGFRRSAVVLLDWANDCPN